MEASWEWVNLNTAVAATKWGNIADWDVSKVTDMRFAFSRHRTKTEIDKNGGNEKALKFNADLGKWDVSKVRHPYHPS